MTAPFSRLLRPALILLVLALAACAPTVVSPPPAPGAPPILITINAAGAGPIGPTTAYNGTALRALLPGYEVTGLTMATELATLSAYGVYAAGTLVVEILSGGPGGTIGAIHGVGLYVAGPNGERIGQTYAEVQPVRSTCRVGTGNWLGLPICRARNAPNVSLVFAVPGATSLAFPSEAALATATLTRIVWARP